MATLAEKQTELTTAKAALAAARYAVQYGQGDRSVTRARLPELEQHVARIAREVAELSASSAANPMIVTPRWA